MLGSRAPNALLLKDLAAKTHRGLRGRVKDGKSGGDLCYGYRVVKKLDERGELIRGDREIDEAQAIVALRISGVCIRYQPAHDREHAKYRGRRTIGVEEDSGRIGGEFPRGKLLCSLSSPAILFADHAAPCRQALGRMLLHPLGELRRAHQAGLHRDVSEVRGGDDLLVAFCRRGETAEHGDDLDHDSRTPSPRWVLTPLTV
jgi:hypothetical protein